MGIQNQFEEFYENIKLTPAQKDDAKIKYNGVCKVLHDYYYPDIEYDGSTKLLIGSYGKGTNIRPPRDIDVVFKMPPEKFRQYDDNTTNKQAQLLQDIRRILSERYATTDKIQAWGKIVKIEFSGSTHSIDLLPAWEQYDNSFLIPNSENNGSWEYYDPKLEIEKIKKSNSDNNQKTIPLIRMVKKWSENCTVNLKSFQIEERVVSYINPNNSNQEYSTMVRDFFQFLAGTSYEENIKSHAQTAVGRAIKACNFEAEGKLENSVDEWKKIFGDDFPKSGVIKMAVYAFGKQVIDLQNKYPSTREEYLDKNYGIVTVLNGQYKVKIDALVEQKAFRPRMLSEYLCEKLQLLKRKSLIFKIIKNTVPVPYDIKWKVRNFGDEAQEAGDLRGEISSDKGFEQKKENTKYKGEHYVECYVIKDGRCVAVDKILVPIQ